MTPDPLSVHAAVLAYGDRPQELSQVLARLESSGIHRIVVIANQVTAATRGTIESMAARGIAKYDVRQYSENLGSAGGYAEALELAFSDPTCDLVWLLDDDNLPAPDAYDALRRAIRSTPDATGIIWSCLRPSLPEMRHLDPRLWQQLPLAASCVGFNVIKLLRTARGGKAEKVIIDENGHVPIAWAVYGGLLLPRKAFQECGPPNRSLFLYGDDTDWTLRMTQNGLAIRLVPDAIVHDLQQPWNATGETGSNLVRRVRDLSTQRVYFEVRNRNWLARTRFPGNRFVYLANRTLFLLATLALAIRFGRIDRFHLIRKPGSVATPRATRDARLARRFATVFGRLVRGSLPKSCLIDPLQTSPGGHPAKTGTA